MIKNLFRATLIALIVFFWINTYYIIEQKADAQQLDATIFVQDTEPTGLDVVRGSQWIHSDGTLKVRNSGAWITVGGGGGGGGIPAGLITFVDSGACASGWTEISGLNGVTLLGTLSSNGDVGDTGGIDLSTPLGTISASVLTMNSYTPTGTNGALTFTGSTLATHNHTFTGNALATHQHELPFQKVAGGTGVLRMIASSVFGVGTSRAAESQSAAPVANTTNAAVLRDQPITAGTPSGTNTAITAGTPAGTINTPGFTGNAAVLTGSNSVPIFSGTQFDNRSAFKRVIFCRKD